MREVPHWQPISKSNVIKRLKGSFSLHLWLYISVYLHSCSPGCPDDQGGSGQAAGGHLARGGGGGLRLRHQLRDLQVIIMMMWWWWWHSSGYSTCSLLATSASARGSAQATEREWTMMAPSNVKLSILDISIISVCLYFIQMQPACCANCEYCCKCPGVLIITVSQLACPLLVC